MTDRKRIFRGDRLLKMRETRQMTQDELASAVGIALAQIYRYENGRADPSPDIIVRIATELGATTDYLLGLVNEPHQHLQEAELTADERKLLAAFRRGDLRDLLKIAVEKPESEKS